MCGSWSQAGCILRVGPGGPWFAAVPKDSWPEDEEACQEILKVSNLSPCCINIFILSGPSRGITLPQ